MEHGSVTDSTASTFSIMEEDHTLANSVRFVLNQDPRVAFCGYSIPHPADNKVNIRVQTTVVIAVSYAQSQLEMASFSLPWSADDHLDSSFSIMEKW
ncbi:hypothetical protein E2562_032881 [Oryza meyeriana var. granulata]|uniref:DNA-directed RNA polymerase RBP11-like dimerisation domain-containing protein n=1 Tax=Oryza meyeriana var. granulata TaxID=110450 RepID=A0A6G1F0Q1_9ORYZ|nr:hypothetical protein E2562_032881 [Oryza meyeriana var. granulata]KAF0930452.1 hypothetical protein E2562_032881 [Oryza meyeriana var. granulata]